MRNFIIETMTEQDFTNYMNGGYNYQVITLTVTAENADAAIEKARAIVPANVINVNHVVDADEVNAARAAFNQKLAAEDAAREAAKVKRIEREKANAAKAGLTVDEYRREKARAAKVKRLEKEVKELTELLNRKRAQLDELKVMG